MLHGIETLVHTSLHGIKTLVHTLLHGFKTLIHALLHGLKTFIQTIESFIDLIEAFFKLINREVNASVQFCKSNSRQFNLMSQSIFNSDHAFDQVIVAAVCQCHGDLAVHLL